MIPPFDPGFIPDVMKEVRNFDKLLDKIVTVDYLFKDSVKKRQVRSVVDRLEYIYFRPNGLRKLLENLRDMQILDRDAFLAQAQPSFTSDSEVEGAVKEIRAYLDTSEIDHGVDFSNLGFLLTYVKVQVREKIYSMLQYLDENDFSRDSIREMSRVASDALRCVAMLNEGLRQVQQKLKTQ
jgi:hypothetical protein